MTDITDLQRIAGDDQRATEVRDVFDPICEARRLLTGAGFSADAADSIAAGFADLVMDRHFGVQTIRLDMGEGA